MTSKPASSSPIYFQEHSHTAVMAERLAALSSPSTQAPPPPRRRTWWLFLFGLIVVAGTAAALGMTWFYGDGTDEIVGTLECYPAERGKLVLSVVEKGELEAVQNTEVVCRVRSSGRGNSIASSIKWVIEDGTLVEKGDVIMRLDDAGLREQYLNQEIVVAEKRELMIRAQHDEEILDSQNRIDLQTARNNVRLAEIALAKYLEGDLEQKRKDVRGRLALAESDLMQWRDRVAWSNRMVRKGYLSTVQAQADESKLQSAEIGLEKIKEEQRVLDRYESQLNQLDLENKLVQAQEALNVVQIQAKSKKSQSNARMQAALSVLRQEEARLNDLQHDINNCTIVAPNDGMVLYIVSEQWRSGSSSQGLIAVGEPVREGQRLLRIPDLRHMQVRIKVHEALVPRMLSDQFRSTGFCDCLVAGLTLGGAGLTQVATGIAAPILIEDFKDLNEEQTQSGHPASIRVASREDPLNGHVKWFAATSSSQDWFSSDVKLYPTVITIDETLQGLRPGMSAEVTVLLEEKEDVLRVPVHAVLGSAGKRFCYVKTNDGLQKRKLVTGLNNARFVEILAESELREGELVVQNARGLAEKLGDLHQDKKDPGEGVRTPSRNTKTNRQPLAGVSEAPVKHQQ